MAAFFLCKGTIFLQQKRNINVKKSIASDVHNILWRHPFFYMMDNTLHNDVMGQEDGQFKAYHPMVVKAYDEMDNFLVEDDEKNTGHCCIYFSSNSLYFPSDEATFQEVIVRKNRFQFYGTRLRHCSRHIFVRDVHKQWYLQGIGRRYNTIEKTAALLRELTAGYRVVTIGSSAGGYAAALFATLLHAEYAISVDAQFSLYDELIFDHLERNPIVDALKDTPTRKYYNLNDVLGEVPVYYFFSAFSPFDQRACAAVEGNRAVRPIPFKSALHGGPFSNALYPYVFDMRPERLNRLVGRMHHPRWFLLRYMWHPVVLKRLYGRVKRRFGIS